MSNFSNLHLPAMRPPKDYRLADTFHDHLEESIRHEEDDLQEGEAIVALCYLPNGDVIQVLEIGYHNPYLMRFYGVDAQGNNSTVLVAMQSVQLVVKTIKLEPEQERRRIGFVGSSG